MLLLSVNDGIWKAANNKGPDSIVKRRADFGIHQKQLQDLLHRPGESVSQTWHLALVASS
jgi:hypothetical protein